MSTEKFLERLRKIEKGNYKDLARRADILPSRMQRLKGGVEPVISVVIALAKEEGPEEPHAIAKAEPKISRGDSISAERLEESLKALDGVCTEYRVVLARIHKSPGRCAYIRDFWGFGSSGDRPPG